MRDRRRVLAPLALALVLVGCGGAHVPVAPSEPAAERSAPAASAQTSPVPAANVASSETPIPAANLASSEKRAGATTRRDETLPATSNAPLATSNIASAAPAADVPVVDEPIYYPGARSRPKGSAVEASLDDEIIATWNRGGLTAEPAAGPKGKPAHAAPRVKVDVTDVRGDASEADMQRVARLKSYWPFRICYEQGLRRMQKLHGSIKLRLTIGSSGRPSGVQQLATELGDAAVVSCVVKSAMGLGFPAPSSGAPQITLDISLWPGDDPVNVKNGPRAKNGLPSDAQAIGDQLRMHLSEAKACYAAGLTRHDGLWGRLALALHVNAGTIDDANEVESHFPDGEVTECVRKVFLHAALASADRELTIVYPLRLGHAPDGREPRR